MPLYSGKEILLRSSKWNPPPLVLLETGSFGHQQRKKVTMADLDQSHLSLGAGHVNI